MSTATTVELPNVGAGPDPLSFETLIEEHEFVLVLLQRDYYCTNCRSQVQAMAAHYDEFADRNTEVVSIVPEPAERLADWQDEYDLPYPLCADPDKRVSDDYEQPVRFGVLGALSDFLGRMPKAVILDCRASDPEVVYTHEGSSTWDRPEMAELFGAIDRQR